MTPCSGVSSDINRVVSQGGHQEVIRKLYEEVAVEGSLLAGRFGASFRTAVGRIPSADDLIREYTDYTVDSLINVIFEEMEVVEFVAERSGSLRVIGTFRDRLRAASRRALAASKHLFTRATTTVACGGECGGPRPASRCARAGRGSPG